jgi:drug/metabolite transporter (DMT)-like permease
MKASHLVLLLLMNAFWGMSYSVYKVIGPSLTSGSIVTLRFGLAALCLVLLWPWLPGKTPAGRDLVITILLGLLVFVIGQRLQVYGNQLGTAGNSSVLLAVEPLVAAVAAAVVLRERLGPRRGFGFVLGMIGVALTAGVGRRDFQWVGLTASLIFVSSFLCEAAYSVIAKPIIARVGVMKMLAISLLTGTGINLIIDGPEATMTAAAGLSSQVWLLLLFLALVCTVVGYSFWFVVIRECPVNVAALTIFAQSVFGAATAALWLHEPLHAGQFLGGTTIALGLAVGLSRQVRRQ